MMSARREAADQERLFVTGNARSRLRREAVTRPARSRLANESIGEFNNSPEPDGQSAPAYPRSQGVVGPAGHVVPVADKGPMPRVQSDFQLLRGHHSLGSSA